MLSPVLQTLAAVAERCSVRRLSQDSAAAVEHAAVSHMLDTITDQAGSQ